MYRQCTISVTLAAILVPLYETAATILHLTPKGVGCNFKRPLPPYVGASLWCHMRELGHTTYMDVKAGGLVGISASVLIIIKFYKIYRIINTLSENQIHLHFIL